MNERTNFIANDKEYITQRQAMQILGISRTTLHQWAAKGKIKKYRKATRVCYKSEEVEELATITEVQN